MTLTFAPARLTTDEMKAVPQRMAYEVLTCGNLDVVDELLDPDFLDHNALPGSPEGPEGFKQTVRVLRTAFPDLRVVPQNYIVNGDIVVEHSECLGTHSGPFMGLPATGIGVRISVLVTLRINSAGQVVERWGQFNFLEILQQLGVAPGGENAGQWASVPDFETGRPTTEAQNQVVVIRHIEEIWNEGRYEAADELFHQAAVAPYAPQLPPGPDGCKVVAAIFRSAFPDFHVTIEDIVAEGDLVAARLRQTGTHAGELFGIPATGKHVDFEEMVLARIVDGRIAVSWFETDLITMMSQLGIAP